MQQRIRQQLQQIEAQHEVRVLYACESGSRAWGFASPDSDYDVRFVYLHRRDWYLSIDLEKRRDVIELPLDDELDISGWDIRKALKLLAKSNPPLLEWLGSPIIYSERDGFRDKMRAALTSCYAPNACAYHYRNMARRTIETYLRGDEVRLKKYFYALRPILAVRWIEANRGFVPTEFAALRAADTLPPEVDAAIEELLLRKSGVSESEAAPRIPHLHEWIESEYLRLQNATFAAAETFDIAPLNTLFRELLESAWR
jgi:predicted nucleotidyltransferase